MKFRQYEYNICSAYLCALINDDRSGLSDQDESLLNDFIDDLPAQNGSWDYDPEAETDFVRDEVSGLAADCIECTYHVQVK